MRAKDLRIPDEDELEKIEMQSRNKQLYLARHERERNAIIDKIPACPKCGIRCTVCRRLKMGVANGCCLDGNC